MSTSKVWKHWGGEEGGGGKKERTNAGEIGKERNLPGTVLQVFLNYYFT